MWFVEPGNKHCNTSFWGSALCWPGRPRLHNNVLILLYLAPSTYIVHSIYHLQSPLSPNITGHIHSQFPQSHADVVTEGKVGNHQDLVNCSFSKILDNRGILTPMVRNTNSLSVRNYQLHLYGKSEIDYRNSLKCSIIGFCAPAFSWSPPRIV